MKIKRKATIRPKSDNWRCIVCKRYTKLVGIESYPNGNMGMALCIPCLRAGAALLPGEERGKP